MSFLVEEQFRNMEHLDLAGVLTNPSSNWQIPAFDAATFEQQDAIYLSSSRQMLEPIMEETSEDEESAHNSWTQYENNSVWSSESETGSVIRIELTKDPDSISERDFACPAKRARRDEFIIGGLLTCQPLLDDVGNHLRKYQRNDLLSTAIEKINSNKTNSLTTALSGGSLGPRKRFDEFYCDMDSLSCNSLSRSSSLIQFESLERQMLNEQSLCSSLGNSSPSLLSFDGGCIDAGSGGSGSNSNRGSTGCLKRYESSDGRLHQTYFDLDKIDFEDNLHFTSTTASKSDSESSSDNSVASHKVLSAAGVAHARGFLKGGKSSAENLSEDSGYCEHIHSVLRAKSKSIPNFENFCEEDEFYDAAPELRKSHSKIQTTLLDDAPKIDHANANNNGLATAAENDDDDVDNDEEEEADGDCWYTGDKNSRRSPSSSSPIYSDESCSATNTSTTSSSCASASSFTWRPAATSQPSANKESTTPEVEAPLHRSSVRSSSLPDIRGEETPFALSPAVGHHQLEYRQNRHNIESVVFQSNSTERVASVPNDLDRIEDQHHCHPHQSNSSSYHNQRQRRSSAQRRQPLLRRTLSASSSSDLDEDQSSSAVVTQSSSWKRNRNSTSAERLETSSRSLQSIGSGGSGVGYINASYSNLTLLDYSGRPRSNRKSISLATNEGGNLKRTSCEMIDETPTDSQIEEDQKAHANVEAEDEEKVHHVQLTIRKPTRRSLSKSKSNKTFDQDPTSLKTSYAQSLEKCNFDPKELSNPDLARNPPKRRFHPASKKRVGIVSSTPNLNAFKAEDDHEDDLFVSSAHTSMHQLSTNEKRLGILLPAGSRASFCKEVSFCPVVSKYCWQEQSSEECSETVVPQTVDDATVCEENSAKEKVETTDNENKEKVFLDKRAIEEKSSCEEKNIEKTSHVEENIVKEKVTIAINSVIAAAAAANPPPSPSFTSIQVPAVERGSDCYMLSDNVVASSRVAIVNQTSPPRSIVLTASKRLLTEKLDNPRPATPIPEKLTANPSGASDFANMSNYAVKCSAASGDSHSHNNNNELMKSKFKADEKHPQHKSFLSRFANGFRFSLRRNKKKQNKELKDVQEKPGQLPPTAPSSKKTAPHSPDFIYIPLKGPVPAKSIPAPCTNGNTTSSPSNGSNNHVLNANKPNKSPPRVVGVSEKRAGEHAPTNTGTQSIDEEFLDNERSYYDFKNQLNGVMNDNSCNTENTTGSAMNNSSQYQHPSAGANKMYHYQASPQQQQTLNHCKIGLIETNLDTHETKISGKTRSLMELGPQAVKYKFSSKRNTSGYEDDDEEDVDGSGCDGDDSGVVGSGGKKSGVISGGVGVGGGQSAARRPHKSMEFLLDKENQKNILPPENELQKSHDNTTRLSEHQLRVQASLQRLNIPDWFRTYNQCSPKSPDILGYKPVNQNFTRKRASDSGRWTGLNSKTTSLSSLGSQRSDRSPLLLSPSAHSHHGGQTTIGSVASSTGGANVSGGFSRWSTSYLNSTQTSPSASTRGSFSRGGPVNSSFISATGSAVGTRNSFRQPYLGWRSQEKLSQPRTPHERLASSLLSQRSPKPEQPVTPEIQTSIKEVTSAIVHYVNDQTNRTNQRSRSASPNSRKCWLESSFVGIRPVESPQTPIIDNSTFSNTSAGGLNHSYHNNTTSATSSIHSHIGINNVTTADGLRINGIGGESAILI